jgi:penicillin G amidase
MSLLLRLLKPAVKYFVKSQSKKSLQDYNESLLVDGLSEKVEIIRDKWGVPHVYAQNQSDLFFAQGYLHAQDRLWQMELTRRVVQGRLSEVIGKDALDVDRISRIMGFKMLGEKDVVRFENNELLPVISSYADGINFFIDNLKNPPVEFKLLKFSPENWTLSDCFGMARLLAMQMSQGFLHELERLGMADKFGMEKLAEIFPEYPPFNPVALKYGIETNRVVDNKLEAFKGPYLRPLGGSNNWVVAPHKMENGAAALCNDPHLLIGTPNIWYENHLIAPGYECTGVSIPGVPLVLIGHNRHIAWGATLSYADIQDTFIEKFTGPSCLQYRFGDRILKSSIQEETISVKGQADHVFDVVKTHHGPAIIDIDETTKISLSSKALMDNDMMNGFYQLNTAENWDDFVGGCSKLTIPSLSLVFADTDNNIGYFMTGEVPVRNQKKGLLPSDGFTAKHEWTGIVPFEEMPHILNPEQGFFYTCNHKLVSDDFPHDLGNIWMNGYRAKRLDLLLNSKEKFNFSDFAQWQLDFYCEPGLQFADLIAELKDLPEYAALPQNLKNTAGLLTDWDGFLTADCIGGTVYQVLKQQLTAIIFDDSKAIRGKVTQKDIPIFEISEFFGHDTVIILKLFKNPDSLWWKDSSPDETLLLALKNTDEYLRKNIGNDSKLWKWGTLHKIVSKHALGVKEPLGEIFDVGNHPIGGDTDTLCQVSFIPGKHYGGSMVAASYRQLIDMGNLSNSICSAPVGQSGNLMSPHYKDQFDMWMKGEYKPMLWTREQVEEYKLYRAVLNPVKS